jgi:outer membrane lipoprotein SlyB
MCPDHLAEITRFYTLSFAGCQNFPSPMTAKEFAFVLTCPASCPVLRSAPGKTPPESMTEENMKSALVLLSVCILVGCGAQRPVLYPNGHLKQVGEERAQQDISDCMQKADTYVLANPGAKVAGGTIVGGAAGTVVGGAAGAVTGHLARGAAVGAATGGAIGLVRGVAKASKPTPVFKAFVNRCLKEKGYEPLGWE